jgi:hypothetical protein
MHHHSCVSGAPSTTTSMIWSAGLRAASAIRPPILDQAEILPPRMHLVWRRHLPWRTRPTRRPLMLCRNPKLGRAPFHPLRLLRSLNAKLLRLCRPV